MLTAIEISTAIQDALSAGRALAIITPMTQPNVPLSSRGRLLIDQDGHVLGGTLGDAEWDELAARYALSLIADERQEIAVASWPELLAQSALESDHKARLDEPRLLFEISRPPLELIICGGGHIGQAIAKLALLLNYDVTVIDDRADFAARDKFPDPRVKLLAADFVPALRALRITPAAHIVIVTRGHRHDEICLQELIDKPARYVGMIGSRRRTTTIRERLKRAGVAPALLRRVHAPIGLDIGALTPEEIALAILAEIVLVRRGGTGAPKSAAGPMARAR